MKQIYLDHNSTAPMLPEVALAMADCQRSAYGNPASQHAVGRKARQVLEDARVRLGRMLGATVETAESDRLIFTSGGTEANNLAIFGLAGQQPAHGVISAIEHPSITEPAQQLVGSGWRIDVLPVSRDGVVLTERLPELLRAETRFVSVSLGNHETGVLQPVAQLAEICRGAGVPLHTDAIGVVGKFPVDFRELKVCALSASSHKFHGPRGIGLLLVRHGTPLTPIIYGGFQQAGLRPGTEAVSLAIGMRRALEIWHAHASEESERLAALRDQLERNLCRGWPEAVVQGGGAKRLPQTSNVSFPGLDRQALLMAMDLAGVACSAGAACASGSSRPSAVLEAMGIEKRVIEGSIRISLGTGTTADEVAEASSRILQICNVLKNQKTS